MKKLPHRKALEKAIKIAGSQSELARRSGMKQQDIWRYLNTTNKIPFESADAICKAVSSKVKLSDFFPQLRKSSAA